MMERGGGREKGISEVFLVHVHALISLIHIKNQSVPTFIINTTLLTLCQSDMFQPSKGLLKGVQQICFNSKSKNELPDIKCNLVSSV